MQQNFVQLEEQSGGYFCLPFSDHRYSNNTKDSGQPGIKSQQQFSNIVLGISDPNAFEPPCKPTQTLWLEGAAGAAAGAAKISFMDWKTQGF